MSSSAPRQLSASEQLALQRRTIQMTHGEGLSETDRAAGTGAARLSSTWNQKRIDMRGEQRIPGLLLGRKAYVSEPKPGATYTLYKDRVLILKPAAGKQWLKHGVPITTFVPDKPGDGKRIRIPPVEKDAKFVLEYGMEYTFTGFDGAGSRDLTQTALQPVWLNGVTYRRQQQVKGIEEEIAKIAKRAAERAATAATATAPTGTTDSAGDFGLDGEPDAYGVEGEGERHHHEAEEPEEHDYEHEHEEEEQPTQTYSPYSFALCAAKIESMRPDEAVAVLAAYDAQTCEENPISAPGSTLAIKYLTNIMGKDWPSLEFTARINRPMSVRVDQTLDFIEMARQKLPYRFGAFEPIRQQHYASSFLRDTGNDPNIVKRLGLRIERVNSKPGDIILSGVQSPGNDVMDTTVHMHLQLYEEDLRSLQMDTQEWQKFGPTIMACAKGRYVGYKAGELPEDQTGTLPDFGTQQEHIKTKGHFTFDVAETVLAAGFKLTLEQFDTALTALVQKDPYVPPPVDRPAKQRGTHCLAVTDSAARAINIGRTKGNLAPLRRGLEAGEVDVVMLAPWRGVGAKLVAEINAKEDREEAIGDYLADNFYDTELVDGKKPQPPMLFYAVAKSGPVMRFVSVEQAVQKQEVRFGAGAKKARPVVTSDTEM